MGFWEDPEKVMTKGERDSAGDGEKKVHICGRFSTKICSQEEGGGPGRKNQNFKGKKNPAG